MGVIRRVIVRRTRMHMRGRPTSAAAITPGCCALRVFVLRRYWLSPAGGQRVCIPPCPRTARDSCWSSVTTDKDNSNVGRIARRSSPRSGSSSRCSTIRTAVVDSVRVKFVCSNTQLIFNKTRRRRAASRRIGCVIMTRNTVYVRRTGVCVRRRSARDVGVDSGSRALDVAIVERRDARPPRRDAGVGSRPQSDDAARDRHGGPPLSHAEDFEPARSVGAQRSQFSR